MTRAIITGGSGFLGSYLLEELLDGGYSVAVYDRSPPSDRRADFVKGDIVDKEAVHDVVLSGNVVFHLAGMLGTSYLTDKARESVDVNICGALNVFDAVVGTDIKVVNIGLLPEWDNTYMITKKASMKFGRMYAGIFGASITTLELSHVYGPKQRVAPYFKAVPTFITQALAGKPLTIFGKGDKLMDLLHVKDAARAIRMAAEHPSMKGEVLAIGGGNRISVVELAKMIIRMTGSAGGLTYAPMRTGEPELDTTEADADMSLAFDILNWKPLIDLDDGMADAIEWYRANSSTIT